MINNEKTYWEELMCFASDTFNPHGSGYDYSTAKAAGMGPDGTGANAGHWGSVAPASLNIRQRFGLPEDSYVLLKGRNHPTWDKAVQGENNRGYKVLQLEDRFYSVPRSFDID